MARAYVAGSLRFEANVDDAGYQHLSMAEQAAVVRSGPNSPGVRAVLEPVLAPAFAALEAGYRRGRSLEFDLSLGNIRLTWSPSRRYTSSDPTSSLGWVTVDSRGRPRRALVDGEVLHWQWILDETVTAIPPRKPVPGPWRLETYVGRYSSFLANMPGGEIPYLPEYTLSDMFEYQSRRLGEPYHYLIWSHGNKSVSLVRGRADAFDAGTNQTATVSERTKTSRREEVGGRFAHLYVSEPADLDMAYEHLATLVRSHLYRQDSQGQDAKRLGTTGTIGVHEEEEHQDSSQDESDGLSTESDQ